MQLVEGPARSALSFGMPHVYRAYYGVASAMQHAAGIPLRRSSSSGGADGGDSGGETSAGGVPAGRRHYSSQVGRQLHLARVSHAAAMTGYTSGQDLQESWSFLCRDGTSSRVDVFKCDPVFWTPACAHVPVHFHCRFTLRHQLPSKCMLPFCCICGYCTSAPAHTSLHLQASAMHPEEVLFRVPPPPFSVSSGSTFPPILRMVRCKRLAETGSSNAVLRGSRVSGWAGQHAPTSVHTGITQCALDTMMGLRLTQSVAGLQTKKTWSKDCLQTKKTWSED